MMTKNLKLLTRNKLKGFTMKKLLLLTFTILVFTYASSVCADDNWYLGASYNAHEIQRGGDDFNPAGISYNTHAIQRDVDNFNAAGIIAGYQYNEYVALEARFNKGTSGYKFNYNISEFPDAEYTEDIDMQASLLIKASYPLLESFNVYILAGYTKTLREINDFNAYYDSHISRWITHTYRNFKMDSGFSYGIGFNYQLNEQFNAFIDYQILPGLEHTHTLIGNEKQSRYWKSTAIGFTYSF
jgi:hypothetical protein